MKKPPPPSSLGRRTSVVFHLAARGERNAFENMKNKTMKTFIPSILLSAAVVLLAGCDSPGYEKAASTSTSLRKASQDIDKSQAQIDVVLAALSDLVNSPGSDMKPQFKNCSSEVGKLESFANDVDGHAAAMQEQGAAYFRKWDVELATIKNEDILTRSSDRKNAVTAQFAKVRASYLQAKADFTPFMSDLKDIRTSLAADLTAGGLASIKGVVNRANEDAAPLRRTLGRLSADFKDLGISLSASTPPS